MSQKEAIATIYALAKTSLGNGTSEREALAAIVELVEKNFISSTSDVKKAI